RGRTMYFPASISICCGQRACGRRLATSSAQLAKGATAWSSRCMAVSPMRLSLIAPAGIGRGQARIVIGGPGIGVMGRGEAGLARLAIDIERVFDDVVPHRAQRMEK